MNTRFRLIWSEASRTWVAVAEFVRARGKRSRGGAAAVGGLAAFLVASAPAHALNADALPTGGTITAGQGTIAASGNRMTVSQGSERLVAQWKTYNIGANAGVTYIQPSASSIALNRIAADSPSEILGSLKSNGQVWLINPAGIVFGKSAQVNVGGLVASTLQLSDKDFLDGKYSFSNGGSAGAIVNEGSLNGKVIALVGPVVRNSGSIHADGGSAALAAGDQVSLDFSGDGLLAVSVDKGALNAVAENAGTITADGGLVVLTARSANALTASAVNNSGTIRARTLVNRAGRILLLADMESGTVHVDGTLDASAPNGGNGGFVETSAARVKVADTARVTTRAAAGSHGTWLIDPVDFTIAASGGDMTGAAVGKALADNGNFTVQSTTGDINVNDTVNWSEFKLTLQAQNNINVNADLNASGTASLAFEYGQASADGGSSAYFLNYGAKINLPAGDNFSTKLGSGGTTVTYKVITDLGAQGSTTGADLQGMGGNSFNLSSNYVLGADIDAAATSGWNSGAGFAPVGNATTAFTGNFDGLNHTISNLHINRPNTDNVGLFGVAGSGAQASAIRNVTLSNHAVTGGKQTGALIGNSLGLRELFNVHAAGAVVASVTGGSAISAGGLVGYAVKTPIVASHTEGSVSVVGASPQAGGIVGMLGASASLNQCYSSASVTGLTGSSGAAGGLAGYLNTGTITDSYAIGDVNGGGNYTGGLAGFSSTGLRINNSYASGRVTGTNTRGVVNGTTPPTLTNVYWDTTTTGQTQAGGSSGGTGVTTLDALGESTYGGFDFTNTWYMVDGGTRPFLRWEANGIRNGAVTNARQLQLMGVHPERNYTLANDIDFASGATPGGMWGTANAAIATGTAGNFGGVGSAASPFTGSFDGQGHLISNMIIYRQGKDDVGFFGATGAGASIRNVVIDGGSVTGRNRVGGLVGHNGGSVLQSYVTADVSGTSQVGGLVGSNDGSIDNTYATGAVSGDQAGGLVGIGAGSVTNSYWDKGTTGQSGSAGGSGLSTLDAFAQSSYGGLDPSKWSMANGRRRPMLLSEYLSLIHI
jgi:filamentous hemagglutinin family protein